MSTPTPAAPVAPAAPQGAPQTTPTPQTTQQPPAPQTGAQPPAPAAPPVPPAPEGEPQDVAALPEWAQKLIQDARAAQPQQPAAPQTPPPPAPVAQPPAPTVEGDVARLPQWAQRAVTDGQGAAQQLALQTAVIAAAPAAGADVSRLLDSQAAMRALSAVNPADAAAMTTAITSVLTTHQHLAAVPQTAPKGGADFGTPGPGAVTAEQFAAMSYAERVDLHTTDPETYRRLAGS